MFESKESINRVDSREINKSISQINDAMNNLPVHFVNGYSILSDFDIKSNNGLSLRVYDPSREPVESKINIEEHVRKYKQFLFNVVNYNKESQVRLKFRDNDYIAARYSIDDTHDLLFGIKEEFYIGYSDEIKINEMFSNDTNEAVFTDGLIEEDSFAYGLYLKIVRKSNK